MSCSECEYSDPSVKSSTFLPVSQLVSCGWIMVSKAVSEPALRKVSCECSNRGRGAHILHRDEISISRSQPRLLLQPCSRGRTWIDSFPGSVTGESERCRDIITSDFMVLYQSTKLPLYINNKTGSIFVAWHASRAFLVPKRQGREPPITRRSMFTPLENLGLWLWVSRTPGSRHCGSALQPSVLSRTVRSRSPEPP